MYFVDRSVAIIKPKEPFHQWLLAVPDNDADLTLESLRSDCTAILLPEFIDPEEAVSYLDDHYEQFFKMELASWYEEPGLWPADLSLKAFWEWFDVEIHSTVMDSVDAEIHNMPAADID